MKEYDIFDLINNYRYIIILILDLRRMSKQFFSEIL